MEMGYAARSSVSCHASNWVDVEGKHQVVFSKLRWNCFSGSNFATRFLSCGIRRRIFTDLAQGCRLGRFSLAHSFYLTEP